MRISSADTVAGQPALAIRKLLKKSQWGDISVESAEETLGIAIETTQQLIGRLCEEGYLEHSHSSGEESWWHNTVKGNAFAMASAAPPIQRRTAERKLAEFLERVRHVNESDEFVYAVTKVIIFGSYVTDATTVNDIDLGLSLAPKYSDPDVFQQKCDEFIKHAIRAGRQFGNYVAQLGWPQIAVFQHLKARSRVYSLHNLTTEQQFFSDIEIEVLFESKDFGVAEG